MNELLKILAGPYEWPPHPDDWSSDDAGDGRTIMIFLGFIVFAVVVYFISRFVSNYLRQRDIQQWRKEMHMDRIDELVAQHYDKQMKKRKNNK